VDGCGIKIDTYCADRYHVTILWRNGRFGCKDHDCRARMQARQEREGATRQQNKQTTGYQQDIGIS
jgi:hypothetical protein